MDEHDYFKVMLPDRKTFPYAESDKALLKEAYNRAHDIRKFEIELYWKRATYFWAFELVTLGGFGTFWLKLIENPLHTWYYLITLYLIGLGGIIISYLWCCVLLGSKFWQENWEKHLDILEEYFSGNLYKTVFSSQKTERPFSVSKASCYMAYTFTAFWFSIICFLIYMLRDLDKCTFCMFCIPPILLILVAGIHFSQCKYTFLRGKIQKKFTGKILIRQI